MNNSKERKWERNNLTQKQLEALNKLEGSAREKQLKHFIYQNGLNKENKEKVVNMKEDKRKLKDKEGINKKRMWLVIQILLGIAIGLLAFLIKENPDTSRELAIDGLKNLIILIVIGFVSYRIKEWFMDYWMWNKQKIINFFGFFWDIRYVILVGLLVFQFLN